MHRQYDLWLIRLLSISLCMHSVMFVWFFFCCKDGYHVSLIVRKNHAYLETPIFLESLPLRSSIDFHAMPERGDLVTGKKEQKDNSATPAVKKESVKTEPQQKNNQKKEAATIKTNKEKNVGAIQRKIVTKEDAAQPSIHITVSNRDNVLHERYSALQEEIVRCWSPPVGMSTTCLCTITMAVGSDGLVKRIFMDASSGILMYDVSARSALYTAKMPNWAKGKSLTITFKQ